MSWRCREALPDDRDGRESLPNVRGLSGGHPACPGVVGMPSRMFGSGWEPSRMSESDREPLTDGRVASQMSGSGRRAIPDVWEWSVSHPRCPKVV